MVADTRKKDLELVIYRAWLKPESQAKPSLEKPGPGTGLIQGSGSGFDLRKPKPWASGQGFEITPMWLLKVVFLILEC